MKSQIIILKYLSLILGLYKHKTLGTPLGKLSLVVFIEIYLITCSLFSQQSRLSQNVNNISEYIASDSFVISTKTIDDLKAVDPIYLNVVNNTAHDFPEALLALTFATVPYKEVPIQIPLIKLIVNYPLVSASDSIFNLKNEKLPRYIFFDSPNDSYGDKDKLAHFFGSAYLSHASNIFDLGNPFGYFVEVFEETFKVQSSIDERDLVTNKLGNIFGILLKKNRNILPSQILILRTISNFIYNL